MDGERASDGVHAQPLNGKADKDLVLLSKRQPVHKITKLSELGRGNCRPCDGLLRLT